ncbi:MAG TPA: VOC family protein [Saprospiraceae bacterium]|nr:VOC family protein [Saprospiraceae bacterium]
MPIPTQYQTVIPYLLLHNALEFLDFTQALFNAEIKEKHMRGDALAHAELKIGNATLMLGGATDEWQPLTSSLFIYVDDADASYAKALELGCTSVMELSNQEYGRTCGVKDVYGNVWWITSI